MVVPLFFLCGGDCMVCGEDCAVWGKGGGSSMSTRCGSRVFQAGSALDLELGVLSLSELGHRRQGLEPDPSAETCWVGRAFPKEEPAQLVPLRPKSHLPGPVPVVLSRCSQSDIQGDLS